MMVATETKILKRSRKRVELVLRIRSQPIATKKSQGPFLLTRNRSSVTKYHS